MSVHELCPGCVGGQHDRHEPNWNIKPGLIGGSYCGCPGDDAACAERAREAGQAAMESVGITPAALTSGAGGVTETPEPHEDWPFQSDGRLEFAPLDQFAALAICARCGAVIVGDVGGQTMHRVWHVNLEQRIARAARALPGRVR